MKMNYTDMEMFPVITKAEQKLYERMEQTHD